ncbi:MAG: hypothetical protein ABWZ40_07875 [Caulobacterales bacterium]
MTKHFAAAAALALAFGQIAVMPAYAGEAAPFRSAPAQTFSAQDLQNYGLDSAAANRAVDLQKQGYEVKVLSTAEAAKYQAGITDNQWLLIGILAGVVVIALAVS